MTNLQPNSRSQPEHETPAQVGLVERRYTKKDRQEIPERTPSRFTYKAQRCHKHLQAKGYTGGSEYAICTTSIGYEGSYKKGSRSGKAREAALREATSDIVKRFGIEHTEHRPPYDRLPGHERKLLPKTIGYSPRTAKWYGWSHRAVAGFGVGSKVKKGDVICKANGDPSRITDGGFDEGFTARTLADAKAMAADFAAQVA